jgi:citrate lyase subunit beta/citryl-CoA lyase
LSGEHVGPTLLVRIGTNDDLDLLVTRPDVMVVVPKADLATIGAIEHRLGGRRITALVESATGVMDLVALSRHPAVERLALGEADLRADLGLGEHADHALWPIRTQLVVASRAAQLEPPVGPVATDWKDLESLRRTSVLLRAAGFGGRSAIHPDQVATIAGVFRPSPDEVAAARRIIEIHEAAVASGHGVSIDDRGRMIDEAVVRSARRVLG